MNKKVKIQDASLNLATVASSTPAARQKLEDIKCYTDHVNGVILPILRECNMHISTPQLEQMTENPELLPKGRGKDITAIASPGAKFLRYSGRRLILNEKGFVEHFTAS